MVMETKLPFEVYTVYKKDTTGTQIIHLCDKEGALDYLNAVDLRINKYHNRYKGTIYYAVGEHGTLLTVEQDA